MLTEIEPEPRSEAERAYQLLRGEILHGGLPAGARMRPSELQETLGVGLTPIREALMRLAAEGLVQGEAQRGFRVREASIEEFADLMSTRRELERTCLALAIMRGDAAWEASVVAAMHLLSRTPLPVSDTDRAGAELWEARHRRFHHALVAACGSEWRLRIWAQLVDHSERYRQMRLLRHHDANAAVRDVNAEHQRIMEAVLARDSPRATDLMDQHLTATELAVTRILESEQATT